MSKTRIRLGTGIISGAAIILGAGAIVTLLHLAPFGTLLCSAIIYLVGVAVGCAILKTAK